MSLIVIGTNHVHSPLEIREKLSFSEESLKMVLPRLGEIPDVNSGIILSTCNRTEIYIETKNPEVARYGVKDFLARFHSASQEQFASHLYEFEDEEAVRHLLKVASGLDSQVLGENQILGQVRNAYQAAKSLVLLSEDLERLFKKAIYVGRLVRRRTNISEGNVSVGSAALSLIKRNIPDLSEKNILIIGAGKISGLILNRLKAAGAKNIFITNRTFERAEEAASSINAAALRFNFFKKNLKEMDIVISSTASDGFILKKEDFDFKKPVLLFDLAMPRDIEPEIKENAGIQLFNLGHLDGLVGENLESRKREAEEVRKIIEIEIQKFWERLNQKEMAVSGIGAD